MMVFERPHLGTSNPVGRSTPTNLNANQHLFQSKVSILAELVRRFSERRVLSTRSGGRDSTTNRRWQNPYFGAEARNAAQMSKT